MKNPFLNNQSPKFDDFLKQHITTTPNQSSFLDSTATKAFLEDETEEPSFVMNEVEQRLKNPVKFTAEKNPVNPTPIERRLILQKKCSQFFQNRTPSPHLSLPSQPLLLDTPSCDSGERGRTPSMAEQFAMFHGEHSSTPCTEGNSNTPIKEVNTLNCTPSKAYVIHSSLKKEQRNLLSMKASPQRDNSSPTLSSPVLECSPGLGTPISEGLAVKPKCKAPLQNVHSKENTSRVRQRLQWTHSPTVNKQRLGKKLRNEQQIIKTTKIVYA